MQRAEVRQDNFASGSLVAAVSSNLCDGLKVERSCLKLGQYCELRVHWKSNLITHDHMHVIMNCSYGAMPQMLLRNQRNLS